MLSKNHSARYLQVTFPISLRKRRSHKLRFSAIKPSATNETLVPSYHQFYTLIFPTKYKRQIKSSERKTFATFWPTDQFAWKLHGKTTAAR